jgi:hypothetical protein
MNAHFENAGPNSIDGQLLRLGEGHEVAIYTRDCVFWAAEFIDGQGELIDANTWFGFKCGSLANSHALRRKALESAIPLSADLVERIEGLHHAAASDQNSPWRRFFERAAALMPGRLSTQPIASD